MSLQDRILVTSLYSKIELNDDDYTNLLHFNHMCDDIVLECYNSTRKKDSTYFLAQGFYDDEMDLSGFARSRYGINDIKLHDKDALYLTFLCKRYDDRLLFILLYRESEQERYLLKIGQYPSVADIHIGEIKQYNKVLSKEQMREFTKGIGLAANGIGVGSFVYLRRIFEGLIFDTAQAMISNEELDKAEFDKSRMDEKINLIKEYLPDFLVKNRSIYSILSKVIHELSEKECLGYFDVMRQSIELILDEKLDALRKEEKKRKAIMAINSITAKLKQTDDNN